jgi:competence protein ComEC
VIAVRRGGRLRRDPRVLAAGVAVSLVVSAVRLEVDRRWPPPGWVVLACDVGQGDGLIVRRPGSRDALVVDAGPADGRMAGCIADAGVRPAAVLLTHFHADHVDGVAEVLARWRVPVVLTTAVPEPPDAASAIAAAARGAGSQIRSVRAGDRLAVAGVELHVLWPARRVGPSPANNTSVVAAAQVPTASGPLGVLLTGDIEPEAQIAVMGGPRPDVAVVKVPHHGSGHQQPHFARWAGADIALVSAGADNDHGHPSPVTLTQYRAVGAVVGRTDVHGALAVTITGAGPGLVVQR